MSISPQRIIDEVERFLSMDDNRIKLYSFLEKFSQCEVYCRHILKQYYRDIGEMINDEDICLEAQLVKEACGEQGIYFDDNTLVTRVFGTGKAPGASSCRWLRNKISHELMRRAIKEACTRLDDLISDMDSFINQIQDQR